MVAAELVCPAAHPGPRSRRPGHRLRLASPRRRSLRWPWVVLAAVLWTATSCGGSDVSGAAQQDSADAASRKVTVAGDSIALGMGITMRAEVEDSGRADELEVVVIAEDGTGLARPDVFDWPARLAELASDFPPEVLVFSVGSNDTQDLTDPSGGVVATLGEPQAWDAEYSARLAEVFDAFEDTDTTVVWVGHVRTVVPAVADGNRHIHELATEVARDRPWVVVEDLAELTGSGAESTSECLSSDGLHLEASCYRDASRLLLARQ